MRKSVLKRITGDKHRKGLERVVWMFVEVDVVSAFPSSTPQDGRKTEVKNIFAVQEYSTS